MDLELPKTVQCSLFYNFFALFLIVLVLRHYKPVKEEGDGPKSPVNPGHSKISYNSFYGINNIPYELWSSANAHPPHMWL